MGLAPRGHRSNYAQVRLTITQEASGLTTYRLQQKDYSDEWQQASVLLHGEIVHHEPLMSLEDAISLCMGVLQSQLLPRPETPE